MEKKKVAELKAIRWHDDDWEMVGKLAARVGLTRSAFIKQAMLGEAAKVLAGAAPHYVVVANASTHNGGAKTFSDAKQTTKRFPEEIGARGPQSTMVPPEAADNPKVGGATKKKRGPKSA